MGEKWEGTMYEGLTAGWMTSETHRRTEGYHILEDYREYRGRGYNGRFAERVGIEGGRTYEQLSHAVDDAKTLNRQHPMGPRFVVYDASTGEKVWGGD